MKSSALEKAKNLLDKNPKNKKSSTNFYDTAKSGVFIPLLNTTLVDNTEIKRKFQPKPEEPLNSKDKVDSLSAAPSAISPTFYIKNEPEEDEDKELAEYLKSLENKVATTSTLNKSYSSGLKYLKSEPVVINQLNLPITSQAEFPPLENSITADEANEKPLEHIAENSKYILLDDMTNQRLSEKSRFSETVRTSAIFKHKPEFGKVKSLNDLMASSESEISEQIDEDIQSLESYSLVGEKSLTSTTGISISLLSATESMNDQAASTKLENNEQGQTRTSPILMNNNTEKRNQPESSNQPPINYICSKCTLSQQEEPKDNEKLNSISINKDRFIIDSFVLQHLALLESLQNHWKNQLPTEKRYTQTTLEETKEYLSRNRMHFKN